MTVKALLLSPRYLSIYVAGRLNVRIPLDLEHRTIAATSQCINIPCLNWNDGDTSVVVGKFDDVLKTSRPDFDGVLETPDLKVILFDADEPDFATVRVPTLRTRIRIWIDHPTEPENVTIAWG